MHSLSEWRVRSEKSREDELQRELLAVKAVPKEFSTTGQQHACSGQTQKLAEVQVILGASLGLGEARVSPRGADHAQVYLAAHPLLWTLPLVCCQSRDDCFS